MQPVRNKNLVLGISTLMLCTLALVNCGRSAKTRGDLKKPGTPTVGVDTKKPDGQGKTDASSTGAKRDGGTVDPSSISADARKIDGTWTLACVSAKDYDEAYSNDVKKVSVSFTFTASESKYARTITEFKTASCDKAEATLTDNGTFAFGACGGDQEFCRSDEHHEGALLEFTLKKDGKDDVIERNVLSFDLNRVDEIYMGKRNGPNRSTEASLAFKKVAK